MGAEITRRLETVGSAKGRQIIWADWQQEATSGLGDSDLIVTTIRHGGIMGDWLIGLSKVMTCPTCNHELRADEFSEDPAPIEERQCDDCMRNYVEWLDETDPSAIAENFARECNELD